MLEERSTDYFTYIPYQFALLSYLRFDSDMEHLQSDLNNMYFFSTRATFSTGDQCVEWWRRLNTALAPIGSVQETFAAAYAAWAKEQPPASVHRALMRASHAPHRHWFGPEVRGNRY